MHPEYLSSLFGTGKTMYTCPMNTATEKKRVYVEGRVVSLLRDGLDRGSLSALRAQDIAAKVVALIFPGCTALQLDKAVAALGKDLPELADVAVEWEQGRKAHISQEAAAQAISLIKQGRIDEAQAVMQAALSEQAHA